MWFAWSPSPVGRLLLAGDGSALNVLSFSTGATARLPEPAWREDTAPFREALREVDAYFAGQLREFTLRVDPAGTAFQRTVWSELRRIPYGETISYGELARRIGSPGASRAVGLANGANPVAIVIPCHRVIGSTGKLTGFGGGLDVKRRLLSLERDLPLFGRREH